MKWSILPKTVLLIAVVLCVLAPAALAATPAATAPVPLLWIVSDADNAVYLLGSFHLLRPDDYPWSGDVDAAFADAESVFAGTVAQGNEFAEGICSACGVRAAP